MLVEELSAAALSANLQRSHCLLQLRPTSISGHNIPNGLSELQQATMASSQAAAMAPKKGT